MYKATVVYIITSLIYYLYLFNKFHIYFKYIYIYIYIYINYIYKTYIGQSVYSSLKQINVTHFLSVNYNYTVMICI